MDYSFEKVKKLYDKYVPTMVKGQMGVMDKTTKIPYVDEDLINGVRFSHAWVYATMFEQSSSKPRLTKKDYINDIATGNISKEEYIRAFNENAKITYETIINNVIEGIRSFGRMYKEEAIEKEVKLSVPYKNAPSIVRGLYDVKVPSVYLAFEDWCYRAADVKLDINQSKQK